MADEISDNAHHILVVDDDLRIADLLSRYLRSNGFRVSSTNDAAQARHAMTHLSFDLIILDVMMPGESGIEFARSLRKTNSIPIIMLTARAEGDQRIEGLESGVDDYMTKPFEPRELLLRIKNILRRLKEKPRQALTDNIQFGDYSFHISRGELSKNGEPVKITEKERELLKLFAQNPGKAIPRHELAFGKVVSDRTIDVQITRLRQKIEKDPKAPAYLQTVRGKGYILHLH